MKMKSRIWPGFALLLCCSASAAPAEDTRQLAPLPPAAAAVLQAEMRDNLRALHGVLDLLAADKVREAGELAEKELGVSVMGRHRDKPFERATGATHAAGHAQHRDGGPQSRDGICPRCRHR